MSQLATDLLTVIKRHPDCMGDTARICYLGSLLAERCNRLEQAALTARAAMQNMPQGRYKQAVAELTAALSEAPAHIRHLDAPRVSEEEREIQQQAADLTLSILRPHRISRDDDPIIDNTRRHGGEDWARGT